MPRTGLGMPARVRGCCVGHAVLDQADADRFGPVLLRRTIALLVLIVSGALAGAALAAVPAPKAGHWKIAGGGGFAVSSDHKSMSGFSIPGASCNLGKLAVNGKQQIRLTSAGGVSNWIVGFGDPKRTNPNDMHGVVGQRVTIKSGKKTLHGRLDVIFAVVGNTRDNSGDLLVAGCDIPFTATH